MQEKLIGFLSLDEPLPNAVIKEINSRKISGIKAEHCSVESVSLKNKCPYSVIVDRISHILPFYRSYLKYAAVSGTYVINNPFISGSDDKFYGYTLAMSLGITVPKTICLPPFEFPAGISDSDLRYTTSGINIDDLLSRIVFPAVLKPCRGYGSRGVAIVNNGDEFLKAYSKTGEEVMLIQEYIKYEHYVRCIAVGDCVLPIKYDPTAPFGGKQYIVDHSHLSEKLGKRILDECTLLNGTLGYDMNSIEFAIKDGIPYSIDFMNPIPDAEPKRISEEYFKWTVKSLADLTVKYAITEKRMNFNRFNKDRGKDDE